MILGSLAPGYPASATGYGSAAYGNTQPGEPLARWLLVRPDGRVTAYAGKVEYGQNIRTGFATEVAAELRMPVESVEVVLGDTDQTPWDMGTFGSQSTARVGLQLRKAAATARQVLLQMAGERLDLMPDDLAIENGRISSRAQPTNSLSIGDLIGSDGLTREIDADAPLTPGHSFPAADRQRRLDAEARVTGRALYSQDIRVEDMLFACILRPPSYNASLIDVNASAARDEAGVVDVVEDDDLLAVVAETDEAAERGLDRLEASWEETQQPSHLDMPEILMTQAKDPIEVQTSGDVERGFAAADLILDEVYFVPYISNLPMEPRAAVAVWDGDDVTVWAGTQRPFGVRSEIATHFRLPESNVRVIAPEIGGAFGTKSYYPAAIEAARIARVTDRPVRVAYTRREDSVWGTFRPAALIEIKSGAKENGEIVAWRMKAYHAGPMALIAQRGAATPYAIDNVDVTVHCSQSPLRVGSYRSLGGAVNHFARESHMDEIAANFGIDPVEYRLKHLSNDRQRRVLNAAAERFGWSGPDAENRGVGVAIGSDVGSYVATCLELHVEEKDVKVRRVVTALDCGLTVNPDGARSQVEGSTVMGLGAALYEAVEFRNGIVTNSGLDKYQVPHIADSPQIEVPLVGDPEEPSTGAGEPGIVTVAPAVANAVFSATGRRIRELPIPRQLADRT